MKKSKIYDSCIINEQWEKDRSFDRDSDKVCYMILCPSLPIPSKKALLATNHRPFFLTLAHNAKTTLAIQDIEINQAIHHLLKTMFSVLIVLRYCGSNKPAKDKIYYLCNRGHNALLRSSSLFDNHSVICF